MRNGNLLLVLQVFFVVDVVGQSGGLIMMWRDSIEVLIRSFPMGHIDCFIICEQRRWRFTGFYGHSDKSCRRFSWELLRRIHDDVEVASVP